MLHSMGMQAVHHHVMAGHAACRARPFTPAVWPPRRTLAAVGVARSAHRATLIDVQGLEACIASTKQAVLKGVNLSVKEGEVHAIMGKNGSGKSTFSKVGWLVRACTECWRACVWHGRGRAMDAVGCRHGLALRGNPFFPSGRLPLPSRAQPCHARMCDAGLGGAPGL